MYRIRRFLNRLLSGIRSSRAEAELAREVRSHLQLLEDSFIARGMSANEARYAARRAFGGVEQAKERQRDARSFRSLAGWSMDLKLGARMLVKYPGLTLVGGAAMAFAIAIGAAGFEAVTQLIAPTLPLRDGHRIVGIRLWDVEANAEQTPYARDLVALRAEIHAIEEIGAFRHVQRNLIAGNTTGEPLDVAEISASAFRITGAVPLLGRGLIDADETPGAQAVVAARRIVAAIFSRALAQVSLGILAGGALVFLLTQAVMGLATAEIAVIAGYMALMLAVCLLACVVPMRRALRVKPMEALRTE